MSIIRYQGQVVGLMGATRYDLLNQFTDGRTDDDADLQRVVEVCEWALLVREVTGFRPGEIPGDLRRQ